ncbi:methyltransferase [Propionivibrio sp.]|uniref:methyltransferase n=1 Tax=Propionivibrio sp. TaxID=2212460 RepID=UPI00261B6729|nr:methyltransferase [Propionivibrio sp.]
MNKAFFRFFCFLERLWRVHIVDGLILRSSIKQFYQVAAGHILFQSLAAAVELDLFTILDREGAQTLPQLALRLGLEEQPCRVLLQGLLASGVVKKRRGRYANTIMSRIAFAGEGPKKMKAAIMWQKHIVYRPMARLLESIREYRNCGLEEIPGQGETLYERISAHPRLEKIFQDSMQEISVQANDLLARYVDFSDAHRVVDVGGGNGTNLLAILQRHPHLEGRVFDLPSVCERARAHFQSDNPSAKLEAIEGNMLQDEFPEGADVFMFCHLLCIWSKAENLKLLKKAHDKLPVGGRAIVFDIMERDTQDGPLAAAMGSPYFLGLATGTGMIYSEEEYEGLCREAGFTEVRRVRLPRGHTAIIATKEI